MILSADTSFLFSLFGKDQHTPKAREMVIQFGTQISISEFNTLELTNASLLAEFAGFLEAGLGTTILSKYQENKKMGRLIDIPINPLKALQHATQLSKSFTLSEGHRTYDVLLVAAALEIKATHFLTFDKRQAKLAQSQGLLIPTNA